MTMGEMHMKLGQNIGEILLDIAQNAIKKTLKSLALIRIRARQTCIAHFGLEFYNKYIHNNDRTRKTSKA